MIASLAFATPASAQTPRFRLTPLVKLGFTPSADYNGTLGINNKGQVVYGYKNESNVTHAWLWMPSADYGLTAGFHDLTTLSESDEPAIARDINESGYIVGQSDGVDYSGGRIAVWQAASGSVNYWQLGALSASTPWSGGHAINDDATPTLVGLSVKDDNCYCATLTSEGSLIRPVKVLFNGTNTLVELTVSPDAYGTAQDVNTAQGSNSMRIVGHTDCVDETEAEKAEFTEPGVPCEFLDQCRPPMNAVTWSPSTRSENPDFTSNGERSRGVNEAEQIVGWGWNDDETCQQRALYWASPSTSPVNLGNTMPSGQGSDESRAEALNDTDPPQVVGWNTTVGRALLWEDPTGATPVVSDLNDASAIGGCNSLWNLREGHDINDDGWIVIVGREVNQPQDIYAILLTPFPNCPVDTDGSGCVDVTDLLAVIAQWGNCLVGSICTADTNADCVVNVTDMLAVIAAWGCTPCTSSFVGGGSPPSLKQLIVMVLSAPASPTVQAEIIEALLANSN